MPETSYGILLCDDLLWASRVQGDAKALGLTLRWVKTDEELLRIMRPAPPRCVILDLNASGLNLDDIVPAIHELTPRPFVVGYGSHVDTATLSKARAAGCDVVWPRSKFAEEVAASLPQWYAER